MVLTRVSASVLLHAIIGVSSGLRDSQEAEVADLRL